MDHRLRHQQRAAQIDIKNTVVILHANLQCLNRLSNPRIIDQHINTPEVLKDLVDSATNGEGIGDIGCQTEVPVTTRQCAGLGGLQIQIEHHNARTLLSKAGGCGPANAALRGGTCNNRNFVFE